MSFPKEVQFFFEHRRIGIPYILWVKVDGAEKWVIMEWQKKPSEQTIEDAKTIFVRSCEIYHKHINFPRFQMEVV